MTTFLTLAVVGLATAAVLAHRDLYRTRWALWTLYLAEGRSLCTNPLCQAARACPSCRDRLAAARRLAARTLGEAAAPREDHG